MSQEEKETETEQEKGVRNIKKRNRRKKKRHNKDQKWKNNAHVALEPDAIGVIGFKCRTCSPTRS